ncbi:hypothetical protein ID866_5391 [Astraeus odoratus]|nr:hypothetical protein ID866_5391 [Astraeus odoratus]
MQQLERLGKDDEDVEIDERIYRHYMSLVSPMSIEYRLLDWFDAISAPEKLKSLLVQANAEIVLGADIVGVKSDAGVDANSPSQVFDPALVPPLVGTLAAALSLEHTKMALIALTVRNKETFSHFMNEIQCFLAVEEVEHDVPDNFISLILDQIDVGLEVKILRVTRQT